MLPRVRVLLRAADVLPTAATLRAACARVQPYVHRTPVLTCASLDRVASASLGRARASATSHSSAPDVQLFFKMESMQRTGSFKLRGATNAVLSLLEDDADGTRERGVVTHSSGNHGAAVAKAAHAAGVPAHVVVPSNCAGVKLEAIRAFGAQVHMVEPTQAAREAGAQRVVDETGAHFIHAANDYRVIAGQATATLELLEQVPDLDAVVLSVGAGGLSSGACLAVKMFNEQEGRQVDVIGAEPLGADDAYRSLRKGEIVPQLKPKTIADGLRTSLGTRTFPILHEHLAGIVRVSEPVIAATMKLIWDRMKVVVEPSASITLGALVDPWAERSCLVNDAQPYRKIGLVVCGGNVDFPELFNASPLSLRDDVLVY